MEWPTPICTRSTCATATLSQGTKTRHARQRALQPWRNTCCATPRWWQCNAKLHVAWRQTVQMGLAHHWHIFDFDSVATLFDTSHVLLWHRRHDDLLFRHGRLNPEEPELVVFIGAHKTASSWSTHIMHGHASTKQPLRLRTTSQQCAGGLAPAQLWGAPASWCTNPRVENEPGLTCERHRHKRSMELVQSGTVVRLQSSTRTSSRVVHAATGMRKGGPQTGRTWVGGAAWLLCDVQTALGQNTSPRERSPGVRKKTQGVVKQ